MNILPSQILLRYMAFFGKPSFMIKHLFWTLLLLSCHSKSDTDSLLKMALPANTATSLALGKKDIGFQQPVKLFDNHLPFEILSFTSSLNKNTTDTDTSKCGGWTLTKNNIYEIIKNSESIDGTTWDLGFLVLTCIKSVKVLQRGQQFDIKINAGAFFSVSNGDTTVLFGDYKKTDRKYFIEGPDNQ